MTRRSLHQSIVGLVGALALTSPLHAQAASISGTISSFGNRVVNSTVTLTAFRDRECAELAERSDRSKAEDGRLATCRTESVRSMNGDRSGNFEFGGLQPGWYSLTASWTYGNFRLSCSGPAAPGWTVGNVAQGDYYGIRATSAPFELKASDHLEKHFEWCH